MPTKVFPGKYQSLSEIANFIRQAAQEAKFSDSDTYELETAVDEACSNIIEHAYGGENKGDIQCSYTIGRDTLTITLVDTGKPFKPHKIQNPDIKRPLASRKTHGLGLYIMRQWMDSVEFSKCGSDNIVTMTKRPKVNT